MKQLRIFSIFFILVFTISCIHASTLYFMYVSLKGDDKIAIYAMDSVDGSLQFIYNQTVNDGPASLALDPTKRFLYVAERNSNSISGYRIDHSNGHLTLINTIAAVDNPVYVSTDKSGRFLLSAYYAANKSAVYSIDTGGVLNGTAVQTFTTGTNPHAILTDPSNRFIYISNMTGNKIQQFSFDSTAGTFSALSPAEVTPATNVGPRHFVFHGTMDIVYFVNETGSSITVYNINATTGVLTELQTISTLPVGYSSTNKCADIHITPDNTFLYASNRGHESIAAFSIEAGTGQLSAIDRYPTVSTPREFDIDPTGNYLYAVGETSNNLAYYKINKTTGVLDSITCFNVGTTPSWVLVAGFENIVTAHDHIQDHKVSCFPNPAQNVFFVNNAYGYNSISIFNSSGTCVLQQNLLQSSNSLDIASLQSGVYIVEVSGKTGCNMQKLIKE